ncbi:MAG: alkaline phosphatase family protein [Candidatus Eisenbacteria bacterium]|nr:alkaline phosphatase family protein [Candidatus Eisenbacteria bacterium]
MPRRPVLGPLLAVFLFASAARAGDPPAVYSLPSGGPPRLVVLLVVDQMRADQLLGWGDRYTGGYRRLLDGGAVYEQCRYLQGPNETAPGHAVLSTGAWAHRNGITANTWWSREENRPVYAIEDPAEHPVGAGDTAGLGCRGAERGVSPRNLRAETLGELLWARTAGSGRVIAVTGKDRAAVLLAGPRGKAYWPDECTGRMRTSSCYHRDERDLPLWLTRFNAECGVERWRVPAWEPLDAGPAADGRPADGRRADGSPAGGARPAFSHPLPAIAPGARPSREYLHAFSLTPYAGEWVLAAAESAVTGLGLGRWEAPDLLFVGLSAHDPVGHEYAPGSAEALDNCRREDLALARFLDLLDERVGRGSYLLALCADHGMSHLPEDAAAWRLDPDMADPLRPHARTGDEPLFADPRERKGRFPPPARLRAGDFLRAADSLAALSGAPAGHWRWWDPYMYFVPDSVAERAPLPERLLGGLRAVLTQEFPMARMFLRSELRDTSATRDPLLRPARLAYMPERAGEFYVVPDPGFVMTYARSGSRHGAPYAYDNHVPLVFYGAGVRPGRHAEPVSPADVAPTLGSRLNIGAPAQAEGHALDP